MPRGKAKVAARSGLSKKTGKNTSSNEENMDGEMKENIESKSFEFKIEPPESFDDKPSPSKLDLSQFKFEKKPHVKIEFEKDSPEKGVIIH